MTSGTHRRAGVAVVVLAAAYAWFATSARPFTAHAYVVVAVPSLAALVIYASLGGFLPKRTEITDYYRMRSVRASWRGVAPWLAIALLAIALESAGLALGGRSPHVPTLSTTVDHLLVAHWERFVLFLLWLAVGASPLRRLFLLRRGPSR
jgi:hypothetical protein